MSWRCARCDGVLAVGANRLLCLPCYEALRRVTRDDMLELLFEEHWRELEQSGELARWQTKVLTEYGTPRAVAA